MTDKIAFTPTEVAYIRRHYDFTLAEMGQQLGITKETVWRWEQGRSVPMSYKAIQGLNKLWAGVLGNASEDREKRF